MARQPRDAVAAPATRLDVRAGQRVIAIPWLDGDEEVISYFSDEAAARTFMGRLGGERPRSALDTPRTLDRTLLEQELDRRRHERTLQADSSMSRPTWRQSAESLVARAGQELIAIPDEVAGETVLRYFVDKHSARAFADARMVEGRPLSWIGAWADQDWDEFVEEIDRIRHESVPTPPIDDL